MIHFYTTTSNWLYFLIDFQLGIAIVNDFKSVEGDRKMGLQVLQIMSFELTVCENYLNLDLITCYFTSHFQ